MQEIRIGAKDLGELELESFCQPCFISKLKVNRRLPFNIFPGIFSSFDSLNKRMVHDHFDKNGCGPEWFGDMPACSAYEIPSRMKVKHDQTGVLVTGEADGIYLPKKGDGVIIVDFKTARFHDGGDPLLPMYTVQLNVYAWQRSMLGLTPANALYLIYLDPQTHRDDKDPSDYLTETGYELDFTAQVVEIELKEKTYVPKLLKEVRRLFDLKSTPKGSKGCKNCVLLKNLFEALEAQYDSLDPDFFTDILSYQVSNGMRISQALSTLRPNV